jgi:hypothetical protein
MPKGKLLEKGEIALAMDSVAVKAIDKITSVRDLTYQHAKHESRGEGFGAAAFRLIPGFPDDISDEVMAEVKAGYHQEYGERHPAVKYKLDGKDTYIPLTADTTETENVVSIGVEYALAFTTFAYGKLGEEQPNLKSIVAVIREGAKNAADQGFRRLKLSTATKKEKTRAPNLSFMEFLKDAKSGVIGKIEKRNKTARQKGDPTAVPDSIIKEAIKAFNVVIENHTMTK